MRFLLIVILLMGLLMAGISTAAAQPAHSCGDMNGLEVVYAHVDNMGIAPQPMPGSEQRFNCIAARDPNFASQRFQSTWQAFNYWTGLYGAELGQTVQLLNAPTS